MIFLNKNRMIFLLIYIKYYKNYLNDFFTYLYKIHTLLYKIYTHF